MDKRKYYKQASVASDYEKERFVSLSGQLTHQKELAVIKSVFKPDEKLLELACGTGRLLKALRQEGWEVMGIDQSTEMLKAGGLLGSSYIYSGDVFQTPIENNALDGAFCFRFTNHYPDLAPFFKECHRLLKNQGHLLFDTLRWSPLLVDLNRFGGRNYPVSDKKIHSILEETGFRVETSRALFPLNPYILGKCPLPLARFMLSLSNILPNALQAVVIWHVRKND